VQLSSRTSNVLNALVSSKQVRFKQTSDTVCTDGLVPDEIRERVLWGRYVQNRQKIIWVNASPVICLWAMLLVNLTLYLLRHRHLFPLLW